MLCDTRRRVPPTADGHAGHARIAAGTEDHSARSSARGGGAGLQRSRPRGRGETSPLKAGRRSTLTSRDSVPRRDILFLAQLGWEMRSSRNLDPELQRRFHYDPAHAAGKEQEQAAAARYVRASRKANPHRREHRRGGEVEDQSGSSDEVEPARITAKSFLNRPAPGFGRGEMADRAPEPDGKILLVNLWLWCILRDSSCYAMYNRTTACLVGFNRRSDRG